jgi:diguanylate cyclase (GGDEF)-like protein
VFFKRSTVAPTESAVPAPVPSPDSDEAARLLDALGALMSSYIRGCFDLSRLPAAEAQGQLEAWRRHALLGTNPGPVEDGGASDTAAGAVGVRERDWSGVNHAFAGHRVAERQFVEKALGDLRDALWVCIERSHEAFMADRTADGAHHEQLKRVRHALQRLETGAVKSEIEQAMEAMQYATRTRQGAHQAIYQALTSRVEQLGRQLDDARRQGETDALTGLGNRLAFDRAVSRQMALHALSGGPLCVVIIDLDHLKPINDTHGHGAGDAALVALSRALHRVFLGEGDQLCRIGGDEFAVILPNSALALGDRLAQRLHTALLDESWPHTESGLPLAASVGVAEWRAGEPVSDWVARADAAMYANKQQRRKAA